LSDGVNPLQRRSVASLRHAACSSPRGKEANVATTIPIHYENVDDATFDLDRYMGKPMPLADEKFKPFGIKGWRVPKAVGTPFGG
jgi:hypothetical protein